MEIFTVLIIPILSYIATLAVVYKAGELEPISFFVAPVSLYKIIFGSGWWLLLPLLVGGVAMFLLGGAALLIVAILWNIVYSVSLAKAFGMSGWFGLVLMFFPIISMFYIAFTKEYWGEVDLIFFLRR